MAAVAAKEGARIAWLICRPSPNWQAARSAPALAAPSHTPATRRLRRPLQLPSTARRCFSTLRPTTSPIEISAAPSGEGIHIRGRDSPGVEEAPPIFISYAWLLDSERSPKSIHASTSQKFFHSSDAIDAVTRALEKAKQNGTSSILQKGKEARIEVDSATGEEVLVLTFDPDLVVLSNAFSRTFCGNTGSATPPGEPFEARIPLNLLISHADPLAYDEWHSDVLGVARPWTAATLGRSISSTPYLHHQPTLSEITGQQAEGAPFTVSWSKVGLSSEELQKKFNSTMLLPPEATEKGQQQERLEALYALTHSLLRDGVAFITGAPTTPTGSVPQSHDSVATLYHIARLLGEIRSTFYGSHLWDVRSMKQSKNVAYTNSDLGFHADLCYFANPPRFQFLHMLKNQVNGGKSLFVDGFAIAEEMWRNHRDQFIALATTPVAFHYNNDGRYYRFAHPTIEIAQPFQGFASSSTAAFPQYPAGTTQSSSSASTEGEQAEPMPRLVAINYSPPFQAPLPMHPPSQLQSTAMGMNTAQTGMGADGALFRKALSTFARLTHDKRFTYQRQMAEGECVVFDNRRVLHSRTGFEWNEEEELVDNTATAEPSGKGEVKRWLKGCYVEGDAVWSTYRVLQRRVAASRSDA